MDVDEYLIRGVQKIANFRLKKGYPLMGENHYSEHDVKWILESLTMILEEYELQKDTRGTVSEAPIPSKGPVHGNP